MSKRVTICDVYGKVEGFFVPETSMCFAENTHFDGNNMISRATGSQWSHEELWKTRKGRWILHFWSAHKDTWSFLNEEEASKWLLKNGHDKSVSNKILEEMEL